MESYCPSPLLRYVKLVHIYIYSKLKFQYMLFSVQEVDSGMYACVATTPGGNMGSATVTVEVYSK